MTASDPRLATVGKVAQILEVPIHRVEYVLRTRTHIQARATAGAVRCFDDDAIAQIRDELHRIAARKEGHHD